MRESGGTFAVRTFVGVVMCSASLLAACELSVPTLPDAAEQFTPPAVYQQWWNLTEACSGVTGDMSAVTWYRVPGAEEIPLLDGTMVNGRWDPGPNRIILAGNSELAGDLVRHEMLHALLKDRRHSRAMFVGRCSGTVSCIRQCLGEGGPPPPPNPSAMLIEPNQLEVGVTVTPSAPGATVNDGNFMMVITTRNPLGTPVIVQLPPSGDAGPGVTYEFELAGEGGFVMWNIREDAVEVTRYDALEIKRYILDFHVVSGWRDRYGVKPGTYVFRGGFGEVFAPDPPTVTVAP